MSLRRAFTKMQERHTIPSSSLVQADWMDAFIESKLGWNRIETSLSKIDQIAKPVDFMSILEGAHICLSETPQK